MVNRWRKVIGIARSRETSPSRGLKTTLASLKSRVVQSLVSWRSTASDNMCIQDPTRASERRSLDQNQTVAGWSVALTFGDSGEFHAKRTVMHRRHAFLMSVFSRACAIALISNEELGFLPIRRRVVGLSLSLFIHDSFTFHLFIPSTQLPDGLDLPFFLVGNFDDRSWARSRFTVKRI